MNTYFEMDRFVKMLNLKKHSVEIISYVGK